MQRRDARSLIRLAEQSISCPANGKRSSRAERTPRPIRSVAGIRIPVAAV